jgi:putative ABC transport system permease protein
MLARAAARQPELAVRQALGARRWRVIRLMLTESVLLALLGGILGTVLGYGTLKAIVAASPAGIPRLAEVTLDGAACCFALAAAALTGVTFGLAPAWHVSRPDLHGTLKRGSPTGSAGPAAGRLQQGLVVVEVTLATVLLVGAGLMLQSLAKLLTTDRGFRAEHVVTAELDFSVSGFTTWVRPTDTRPQVRLRELLDRVRQLPGVQAVGASYRFLRRDNRPPVQPFTIFGRPLVPDADRPLVEPNAISPGFLEALGITLLRGRGFAETDDLEAPGVALVNQSFVRQYFPDEDPIGQHVTMERSPGGLDARNAHGLRVWSEIVGVVNDVRSLAMQPRPVPEIYVPYWQWPMQNPTLVVRATGDVAALQSAIRGEVKRVVPSLPAPRQRRLTEQVDESLAQPRFQAGALGLFAALALFLAASGIYAVLAYGVALRRRELGIRLALGASRRVVIALVLRQGVRPVVLGLLGGFVTAWALTRFLRSLLYEISPGDPLTFAAIGGCFAAVALLAAWLPAARAARTNPMAALRSD